MYNLEDLKKRILGLVADYKINSLDIKYSTFHNNILKIVDETMPNVDIICEKSYKAWITSDII